MVVLGEGCDAVMLHEIEYDTSTPSGEHWVGRNLYKWFPGNEEYDIKTTWSGTITTYSKLETITGQGYQSDVIHVLFADADECDMDEELLRRLLCSSGTMDGARRLINWDAWDLAIYLHTVTDMKQHQGLGMECRAASNVCACVFGRDCTLEREGKAMRSCLGQLASNSLNLSILTDCADAKSIQNILKLGVKDDRVTFVQEVQTPGYTGVTNAQHGNLLSFKWP